MATMPFTSPLLPGKCATPLAISAVETSITFPVDGSTVLTGSGRLSIVCDVDWFYSDTFGSGRKMLVAPNQAVVIPFYDDLAIGAATVSGSGTLYAMLLEAAGVR